MTVTKIFIIISILGLVTVTTCFKVDKICEGYLQNSDSCPEIQDPRYANCCQHQPDTLHCVSDHKKDTGSTSIKYGCFTRHLIQEGHALDIIKDSLVPVECHEGWFEPDKRWSDAIHHPYCTWAKTRAISPSQQLGCRGGPAADDGVYCTAEFTPYPNISQCLGYFGDEDSCECKKNSCPQGQTRHVSFPVTDCPSQPFRIDYRCKKKSSKNISTSAQTTTTTGPPTSTSPPANSITTGPPPNSETDLNYLCFLLLIPVTCICILVYICKRKNITPRKTWYQLKEKLKKKPNCTYSMASTGEGDSRV